MNLDNLKQKYPMIPDDTLEGIMVYVKHHRRPGSFLRAVLSNDLAKTVYSADNNDLRALVEIVKFIMWEIPSAAWGSKEQVNQWLSANEEK